MTSETKIRMVLQTSLLLSVFLVMLANAIGMYYVDLSLNAGLAADAVGSERMRLSLGFNTNAIARALLQESFLKLSPLYILLCFILPFLNPIKSSLLTLMSAAVILMTGLWGDGLAQKGLLLEFSLLTVVMIFSVHVILSFFTEYRDKQKLSKLFGQYIPPELAKVYSEKGRASDLEGSAKNLSILFCDIQGFSTLSEGMEPKELANMLNEFLTAVTKIIYKHEGTIDKYIGDSVMAFWGAPLSNDNQATHALHAALDIQVEMQLMRQRFEHRGWPAIHVGVGINAGVCSVGNMGSEFRMAYTAIGDAVNIAARLEKLTRAYKTPVIVSESVAKQSQDYLLRELDSVQVRGRSNYVRIYQPLVKSEIASADLLAEVQQYNHALDLYRQKQWQAAETAFLNLQNEHPDDVLYARYLKSIAHYKYQPPNKHWQGSLYYIDA